MKILGLSFMLLFFVLIFILVGSIYLEETERTLIFLAGFIFIGVWIILTFREGLR